MNLVVAGSRKFDSYDQASQALAPFLSEHLVILSGTARGADRLGERWAEAHGVLVRRYPADWEKYGKAAGYIRNEQMAKDCDAALVFWDGVSRGTKHMIEIAEKHGKHVTVVRFDKEPE